MQFPVIQHNRSKEFYRKDSVVTESPLRLVLIHTVRDTQQKVDLGITLCSPDDPCDLIRGWLYHHQLLEPKEDCQIHLPDNHAEMVVTATLSPIAKTLKSEVAIVSGIAKSTLGNHPVNWASLCQNYDRIRNKIQSVIPGFENFNQRVRQLGGFYLPNRAKKLDFSAFSRSPLVFARFPRLL